jgi:hypothetical protein
MSGATNMAPPRMVLGKHPRCTDETDVDEVEVAHDSTCKRAKEKMATSGVLAVADFTSRARQMLAARTPAKTNYKSQAVGHRARRLVTLKCTRSLQSIPTGAKRPRVGSDYRTRAAVLGGERGGSNLASRGWCITASLQRGRQRGRQKAGGERGRSLSNSKTVQREAQGPPQGYCRGMGTWRGQCPQMSAVSPRRVRPMGGFPKALRHHGGAPSHPVLL